MEINSIKEFNENFIRIYYQEILPNLKYYEQDRLKEQSKLSYNPILSIIILILFIFICIRFMIFIYTNLNSANSGNSEHTFIIFPIYLQVFIICICLRVCEYYTVLKLQKKFERKFKAKIMPKLMRAFGDFEWVNSYNEISNILKDTVEYVNVDDVFRGTYRNKEIFIIEQQPTNGYTESITVAIISEKGFSGYTKIVPEELIAIPDGLQKVHLEDTEFEKYFNVYTTNQVEARYILTPDFIVKYKDIQKAFHSKNLSFSFKNNNIVINIPVDTDMFFLGNLSVSLSDKEEYTRFFNEFISIFNFIDVLEKYGVIK